MEEKHNSPIRNAMKTYRAPDEQQAFFAANGAIIDPTVVVLGSWPLIKNKYGGQLFIGKHTVLNSDNENSNTPIPTPVKFVLGVKAVIVIGENCDLNGASITAYKSVNIGDRVQIGAAGLITDTDFHPVGLIDRRKQVLGEEFPFASVNKADVCIQDDVWIGYGVTVLKGVTIGAGSVIGAGSGVTKSIPAYSIAA